MLKTFLKQLKRLFTKKPKSPADDGRSSPYTQLGSWDGGVEIKTQSQLDKRTHFKPGETYMLGEAIVTVHATKADARRAVLMTYIKRRTKRAKLRERAIELMLMTPEQINKLNVDEWLKKRNSYHKKVFTGISGLPKEAVTALFKKLMVQSKVSTPEEAKEVDKVEIR